MTPTPAAIDRPTAPASPGAVEAVVREALGALASASIGDLVLARALERAQAVELPDDPVALRRFVEVHLAPEAEENLGAGTGELLVTTLGEVLSRATRPASAPPETGARKAAAPEALPDLDLGAPPAGPVTAVRRAATAPVSTPDIGRAAPGPAVAPWSAPGVVAAGAAGDLDLVDDLPLPELEDDGAATPPVPPRDLRAEARELVALEGPPPPGAPTLVYAVLAVARGWHILLGQRALERDVPSARHRLGAFLGHLARELGAAPEPLDVIERELREVLERARPLEGRLEARGLAPLLTVCESVAGRTSAADAATETPAVRTARMRELATAVSRLGGRALRLGWTRIGQAATSTSIALRRTADLDEDLERHRLAWSHFDATAVAKGAGVIAGAAVGFVALLVALSRC